MHPSPIPPEPPGTEFTDNSATIASTGLPSVFHPLDTMFLNFNDWGELTIDIDSLGFDLSENSSDEHTPTGARIEIDHENVYLKLTENAERLAQGLQFVLSLKISRSRQL